MPLRRLAAQLVLLAALAAASVVGVAEARVHALAARAAGDENVVVSDGDRIVSFSEAAPHVSIYVDGALHAELSVDEACFGERCTRAPTFVLGMPAHTGLGSGVRGERMARARRGAAPLPSREGPPGFPQPDAAGDAAPPALSMHLEHAPSGGDGGDGVALSLDVYFVDAGTRLEAWGERLETHASTLAVVARASDGAPSSAPAGERAPSRGPAARPLGEGEPDFSPSAPVLLRLRWTGAEPLLHTQNYVGRGHAALVARSAQQRYDASDASAEALGGSGANRTAFLQLGKTALLDDARYVPAGTRVSLRDRTALCDVVLPPARSAGYLVLVGVDEAPRAAPRPRLSPMRLVATASVVVALLVAGVAMMALRVRAVMVADALPRTRP